MIAGRRLLALLGSHALLSAAVAQGHQIGPGERKTARAKSPITSALPPETPVSTARFKNIDPTTRAIEERRRAKLSR